MPLTIQTTLYDTRSPGAWEPEAAPDLSRPVAGHRHCPSAIDPFSPVALDRIVDGLERTAQALAHLRDNSFSARRQRDLGIVSGLVADTLERAFDLLIVRAAAETRGGAMTLRVGRHRTLRSDWLEAELAHSGKPIESRDLPALLKSLNAVASGRSLPPDHRFEGFSTCQSLCSSLGGGLLIDGGSRGMKERYVVRLPVLRSPPSF